MLLALFNLGEDFCFPRLLAIITKLRFTQFDSICHSNQRFNQFGHLSHRIHGRHPLARMPENISYHFLSHTCTPVIASPRCGANHVYANPLSWQASVRIAMPSCSCFQSDGLYNWIHTRDILRIADQATVTFLACKALAWNLKYQDAKFGHRNFAFLW